MMEQIGYSLVDADGNEVWHQGDTKGQLQSPPNVIFLPNGDQVHCPVVGEQYGDWRLVERWLDDNPPGEFYAVISQTIAFDGTKVIVTNVYENTPSLQPPPPAPDAPAIVEQSYRAGLVRDADKLETQGKDYEATKLLLKATS